MLFRDIHCRTKIYNEVMVKIAGSIKLGRIVIMERDAKRFQADVVKLGERVAHCIV